MRNQLHDGIPKVLINKNASDACIHHNKFLSQIQNDDKTVFLTHEEFLSYEVYRYKGKDTIIGYFVDRISNYNKSNDFGATGEVITSFILWLKDSQSVSNFINRYMTNRTLAFALIKSLKESPDHYRIISGYKYNMVAIDVSILNGVIYLTMNVGFKREIVDGQIVSTKNSDIYKKD